MPSLLSRAVALYLRLVYKPRMATRARAQARISAAKADPAPPARFTRRHRVEAAVVDGFTCYTVTARGRDPTGHAVLYLHGGAYISEITPEHWSFIGRLAEAGIEVVVPIYGLAPRYTHRDAFPTLTEVYRRLVGRVDPALVTIAGDSAGGGLALAFAQTLGSAELPQPGRLVLIAPWLDLTLSNPAITALEDLDPWLTPEGLIVAGQAWAGGDDPGSARLSPIHGRLAGLPPIDTYIGTHDVLYPDICRMHALATAAGSASTMHVVAGGFHVYPLVPIPEGRAAVRQIIRGITSLSVGR